MTTQEALIFLATSTSQAAADALRIFAPDDVGAGPVAAVVPGREPFESLPVPAVLASINYTEGAGGNFFAMPLSAARKLAEAMIGAPSESEGDELSELELSAVGEAMNQMMAAAAASTSATLDLEVDIDPPNVTVAKEHKELGIGFQGDTRTSSAVISVFGERCVLAQLIPPGFTLRLTQTRRNTPSAASVEHEDEQIVTALRGVPLRVWAELGRTRLPSAQVAGLGDGAIVDLDRAADDPVDLFVNGSRFATGRLVVDGDDWAVRIEEIFEHPEVPITTGGTP